MFLLDVRPERLYHDGMPSSPATLTLAGRPGLNALLRCLDAPVEVLLSPDAAAEAPSPNEGSAGAPPILLAHCAAQDAVAAEAQTGAAVAAARAGRRVVALVGPAAAAALGGLDPRLLLTQDRADPLVLRGERTVRTADGDLLAGADWVSLAGIAGEPLAELDGAPVIVTSATARGGRLIIVGCPDLLREEFLAAADTAGVLANLLTGSSDLVGPAAAVKGCRPRPPAEHPRVPVTIAPPAPDLVSAVPVGAPVQSPPFLRAVAHAARLLPAQVHDALVDFADTPPQAGAMLLRRLPVGQVPATPLRPGTETGKDPISEFVLLTVARRLGQPVGYLPEHGGRLVQSLSPTPDAVTRQTSTSSGVQLAFHTETAFHPHKPRYLLLLCLRGDPAAATTLCSVHAVLDRLTLGTIQVLRQPRFRTSVDESFLVQAPDAGQARTLSRPVPVLAGTAERPVFTFDADLMVGTDAEAQAALGELSEAVAQAQTGVYLAAGDLLVVDNTLAVHGRSPFTARFDGTDRWLQRTFVVPDLTPSAGEREDRVITTRFAG